MQWSQNGSRKNMQVMVLTEYCVPLGVDACVWASGINKNDQITRSSQAQNAPFSKWSRHISSGIWSRRASGNGVVWPWKRVFISLSWCHGETETPLILQFCFCSGVQHYPCIIRCRIPSKKLKICPKHGGLTRSIPKSILDRAYLTHRLPNSQQPTPLIQRDV